jgi:hypothetical protein
VAGRRDGGCRHCGRPGADCRGHGQAGRARRDRRSSPELIHDISPGVIPPFIIPDQERCRSVALRPGGLVTAE